EQLPVAYRDEMDPLVVATVELVALGHALLDAEHVVAELERGRQLLPALRAPDLDHGGAPGPGRRHRPPGWPPAPAVLARRSAPGGPGGRPAGCGEGSRSEGRGDLL